MKKSLLIAGLATLMAMPMMAQNSSNYSPSASRDLYNFEKYDFWQVLDYFKELNDNGKMFPTSDEFKKRFGIEPERMRSHVAKRMVLTGDENKNRLHPQRREERDLWMNLPAGYGKVIGGYPSGNFTDEPYTMWQYTDLWGSWNHGLFQAPGSWADAAHKHGTDLMSGVMFFDTTGGRGQTSTAYMQRIARVQNGKYVYVKPYIHLLLYLGLDGINYNWEASGLLDVKGFHLALRDYADEVGFTNFRQGVYGHPNSYSQSYADAWLWDRNKQKFIGDVMLNYSGSIASNSEAAKNYTGSYEHLYQGYWIVSMRQGWSGMESSNGNVCLWGEHGETRFYQNNSGETSIKKMENLQGIYERAFSGGSRNPGIEDSWQGNSDWNDGLETFGGLCRLFTERTTIKQDLPFQTFFNLGNGERWYYKGKTAAAEWYNLSSQDMMPTYRWLQYQMGTKTATQPVMASFTYDDAYIGGSSLRISRKKGAAAGQDLILYRGLISVKGQNPKARIALKSYTESSTAANLSLILHVQGDEETKYRSFDLADLKGKTWEAQELELEGIETDDVIDFIGLRLGANAPANYEMLVGEITLMDDSRSTIMPKAPTNLRAEIKAETQKSMVAFLSWDGVAPDGVKGRREQFGMLQNDELGVDHFEVFYKDGQDGQPREIGRTASWNAYIPTLKFEKLRGEQGAEQPFVGVRAVGMDLKSMSDIVWLELKRAPSALLPKERDLRYCITELDKGAAGVKTAQQHRYLTKVTTTGALTDLNYTSNSSDPDGDNYVDATDIPFTVQQGQNLQFYFKAANTDKDGLQYCWAATYIDWNNNGIFEPEQGEAIQELALGKERKSSPEFQSQGVTRFFKVPVDATPGTVRVRIIFTDAWFPKPTPCAKTNKGFSIDFSMKVTGDNEGREVVDHHDQGDPEAPEMPVAPDNGDNNGGEDPNNGGNNGGANPDSVEGVEAELPSFYPNPVESKLYVKAASHAWIFTMDGVLVKNVADTTAPVEVSDLPAGTYIIKLEQERVTRSYKLIKR